MPIFSIYQDFYPLPWWKLVLQELELVIHNNNEDGFEKEW